MTTRTPPAAASPSLLPLWLTSLWRRAVPSFIVSKNINKELKKKYESQYNNVTFIQNDSFHDRFIIIDKVRMFIIGASLKDIGKKCFAICENKDINYLYRVLDIINMI